MDAELRGVVIGLMVIILVCGVLLIAAEAAPTVLKLLAAL
jgi:hypothetical protein